MEISGVPLEIPGFHSVLGQQGCCWEQQQAPDWFGQSFVGLQAGFKIRTGCWTHHLVSPWLLGLWGVQPTPAHQD